MPSKSSSLVEDRCVSIKGGAVGGLNRVCETARICGEEHSGQWRCGRLPVLKLGSPGESAAIPLERQ